MTFANAWSFMCDHNVPESLANWLEENGQTVTRSRDAVGEEAADPIVAKYAVENRMILVSWDKDFGHQRFASRRYEGLARIGFSCPEPMAVERIIEVVDLLDFAIARSDGLPPEIRIARDKVLVRDKLFRQ